VRDQRGAAAIEFALVLPILIMLVYGIYQFGVGYNLKVSLTAAAREGARAAAVGEDDPEAVTRAAVTVIDEDDPDLSVTVDPNPCVPGEPVTVTVTYPYTVLSFSMPFASESLATTITGTGVMRCGG
jgi:Flp pilus assembly protein TadG